MTALADTPAPPEQPPAPHAEPIMTRGRRRVVGLLLGLAIVIGFFAVMATWLNRQALNTTNWTNTSTKLLEDAKIRTAISDYLVNELFTNVDVAGQLRAVLPPQAQPIAGPIAGGLRELAFREAPQLLARPRVQEAWKQANLVAHKQLLAILNGGGSTVGTTNGDVTLNLRPLVDQLAAQAGISKQVNAARAQLNGGAGTAVQNRLGVTIPSNTGKLVIMRSDQIRTAQDVAKAVKGLSYILTALTLILFAVAVALAPGMRRTVLRRVGWSFVGIGIAVLLLRRVGGNSVVNGLAGTDSVKGAVHDAWIVGSSLLYTIAITVVVYGILIVLSAWLGGETSSARRARQALAPTMRDHPALVYGVVAFVYLLVLVWGPAPAFRHLLPILLIAGLVVLGVEVIRRQSVREFPDARPGDAWHALRA
jgi:hypothetical protein